MRERRRERGGGGRASAPAKRPWRRCELRFAPKLRGRQSSSTFRSVSLACASVCSTASPTCPPKASLAQPQVTVVVRARSRTERRVVARSHRRPLRPIDAPSELKSSRINRASQQQSSDEREEPGRPSDGRRVAHDELANGGSCASSTRSRRFASFCCRRPRCQLSDTRHTAVVTAQGDARATAKMRSSRRFSDARSQRLYERGCVSTDVLRTREATERSRTAFAALQKTGLAPFHLIAGRHLVLRLLCFHTHRLTL